MTCCCVSHLAGSGNSSRWSLKGIYQLGLCGRYRSLFFFFFLLGEMPVNLSSSLTGSLSGYSGHHERMKQLKLLVLELLVVFQTAFGPIATQCSHSGLCFLTSFNVAVFSGHNLPLQWVEFHLRSETAKPNQFHTTAFFLPFFLSNTFLAWFSRHRRFLHLHWKI